MESPRGNILTVDWDHTGRIEALRMTMRGYELLCDGESRILTAERETVRRPRDTDRVLSDGRRRHFKSPRLTWYDPRYV